MSLTYRDANEQNNQQADRHRDGNQVLFQRLKVVKNLIAIAVAISLLIILLIRIAVRQGHLPLRNVSNAIKNITSENQHILRAAMGAEIRGIHRWPDGLAL